MQGGSHNRKPPVKKVCIAIEKNISLFLKNGSENANCMSDNDTSLVLKDFTPLCEQAASLFTVSFHNNSIDVEHADDNSIDVDDSNY